jgi:hypothetical protein
MSAEIFRNGFCGYELIDGVAFGGWKPPSNRVISAAVGLFISACIAMRLAVECPKSGDIGSVITATRHALLAATFLIGTLRASR